MSSRFSHLNRVLPLAIFLSLFVLGLSALAQENYIVSTQDGTMSLYDLATNSLITSAKGGIAMSAVLAGPNNRLLLAPSGDYTSVVDTTLQREILRIADANGLAGAMTPDGKLLLVSGYDGWLRFIDTSTFQVVRKVSLKAVLGTGWTGSVVIAANKAYVFPYTGPLANVAVVDLTSYAVSSITLPDGYFSGQSLAAAMPDGQTIVTVEQENGDGLYHVLAISTATNVIIGDYAQDSSIYYAYALTVTPNGSDPSKIFGYMALQGDLGDQVVALDLRANSPTYGHVLLGTAVFPQLSPYSLAINSDGSRLILVGSVYFPPSANTYVIDALKMISDPADAIIAQITAGNGAGESVGTGFFSTTPPGTAPAVSGVSSDITNDAPHEIQVTGGNFMAGALAKIGGMTQLPTTFMGGGALSLAVPANAPAGKALDVIVTNPETQGPQDQQNQSGLLAGQFNILLNPKFQPSSQFVSLNGDTSLSIYNLGQRGMVNIPFLQSGVTPLWAVFNTDGKELYISSFNETAQVVIVPIDLSNNLLASPIVISGSSHQISSPPLSASVDPKTGKPVVNIIWRASGDIHVGVLDSDPGSPTFNTILRTFDAGIHQSSVFPFAMTTTADGKFAYMWYRAGFPYLYSLGIMDLSTGAFTQASAASFGVVQADPNNGIRPVLAPDGKSLILSTFYGNRWRIVVVDISKPTVPKRIAELVPVPVPGHGFPAVTNYQVVGDRLYAFDPTGIIVVFNFDRSTGDLRQRGWYLYPIASEYNSVTQSAPNFAFSSDGAWLYAADSVNDQVTVLDPAKVSSGKDAVVTTIRAPAYPYLLAVSPVAPPTRPLKTPAPIERKTTAEPAEPSPAFLPQPASAASGTVRSPQP